MEHHRGYWRVRDSKGRLHKFLKEEDALHFLGEKTPEPEPEEVLEEIVEWQPESENL